MKRFALALSLLLLSGSATVLTGMTGKIRVEIKNGTRKQKGTAEKVVLIELGQGMTPVRELGPVNGRFALDGVELSAGRSYLLQVTYQDVTYNEKVTFRNGLAELELTVFDTTDDWKDVALGIARVTLVRQGDQLLGQKFYVVENRTSPPRTLLETNGTFRFPLGEQERLGSVTASHDGGIPVPRTARREPGSSAYLADVAFKPGITEVSVGYTVDYHDHRYRLREEAYYDFARVILLISPRDLKVSGENWEHLEVGASSRFQLLRRVDVRRGEPLEVELSGGDPGVAATASTVSTSSLGGGGAPHGALASLPDPSRRRRALLLLVMALSLGFGVLARPAFRAAASRFRG